MTLSPKKKMKSTHSELDLFMLIVDIMQSSKKIWSHGMRTIYLNRVETDAIEADCEIDDIFHRN